MEPSRSTRLLGVTVAIVAALLLVTWLAASLVPPRADAAGTGGTVLLPTPDKPAVRVVAPAGWSETAVPDNPDRALVWSRGTDTISAYASTRVRDVNGYAARLLRLAETRSHVRAVPAGLVRGPDGLTGPRFRLTDDRGRTGELVVLGRGRTAVGLITLADPARPVDLRPTLGSLRVAS